MGFWGVSVKQRNRAGRIEYYGKCDGCSQEKSGWVEKEVKRELERCESNDKKNKKKQEAAKEQERLNKIKENQQNARAKKQEQEEREAEHKRAEMHKVKKQAMKKYKELDRESKGLCGYCGQKPCKGTKPRCARYLAHGLESLMDFNPADPGEFDPQLRWYNNNMK